MHGVNQTIKIFRQHEPEYQQALALRDEVLRKPLGMKFTPKELEKDKEDVHFGLFIESEIVACLTLTDAGSGRLKMRQVAVKGSQQGKGFGRRLSEAAEQYAVEKGYQVMFCHARKEAVPFYKSLGYHITGDEFSEINIPHYRMDKSLL